MGKFRLRTKFLFSLILVGVGLTAGTLLVARQTAEQQVRLQIDQDLRNSVYTFHNVQKLRETVSDALGRIAGRSAHSESADDDQITRRPFRMRRGNSGRLAGSDLLVLADRIGKSCGLAFEGSGL